MIHELDVKIKNLVRGFINSPRRKKWLQKITQEWFTYYQNFVKAKVFVELIFFCQSEDFLSNRTFFWSKWRFIDDLKVFLLKWSLFFVKVKVIFCQNEGFFYRLDCFLSKWRFFVELIASCQIEGFLSIWRFFCQSEEFLVNWKTCGIIDVTNLRKDF